MEFRKLYLGVLKKLKSDPTVGGFELQGILQDNWSEIKNADSNAESLVSEINKEKNGYNYTTINAILNSHINRVERIEHFTIKQLNYAVKVSDLNGYDIEAMCSVRHKVKKGNRMAY